MALNPRLHVSPLVSEPGLRRAKSAIRGAVALLVLTVVSIDMSGVAEASAGPKVQFFGPFTSYQQSVVGNAQGLVANAAGNLYVSGTTLLGYVPVDVNGNPIIASQQSISSESSSDVLGMAIDAANNLYRVDPAGGTVQKYTYGGSPTSFTYANIGSGWSQPSSVAVDSSSNVYVLDAGPGTIVKLTPSGGSYTQTTLYTNVLLKSTTGLSIDQYGNFYVASGPSYGVYSLSGTATPAVYKLTPGGGTYTLTTIGSGWTSPSATAVDSSQNVWVADYGAGTINLLVPSGLTYTQSVYQSISTLRTLMVNQAGKLYGFAYGSGSAVIWAGGSAPHNLGTYNVGTSAPTVAVTVHFMVAVNAGGFAVTTQGSVTGDFQATGGTCAAGS
ncbi:MAG: hypothetical protein P4L03_09640 [Terracidiphilus sp.]|nr:hypothetical protein [Terracidiphilus sp.]